MFTQQNTNNSQNQTAYQQTGKTPVGAFYLHKKPYEEKTVNPEEVQGIKNKITNALSSMKDNLSNGLQDMAHQMKDFDPMEFAKNIAVQSPSKFIMKYATAITVAFIKNKPVKSEAVLDLLFLHFAPQLHQTALFMGYLSVTQMRRAMSSGNFSVVGFLRGFNDGLKVFQDEKKIQAYAEQYEDELPIDLIESCKFEYKDDVSEHVTKANDVENLIANGAKDVTITLVAHVKNKYGDFSKSNDYVHKLENCMAKDFKPHEENKNNKIYTESAGTVTLRVGKDIYENCFLKSLNAEVTSKNSSVYDMKITAKLLYNIFEGMYSENSMEYDGITILNPNPSDVNGIRGNFDFETQNV